MRAMWSGAVSFGLVSVPVKLYSATENHDIRFHQVHGVDGGRIRYKRTCTVCGEEVDYADIVKGYETPDGELITLDEADLESLPTASSNREIDVVEFVPADEVDPLLLDRSYYLEPETKAVKPYVLLREALRQTDRMALVKVAIRQRESLAVLRVRADVIVLQTMLWTDEVRTPDFEILESAKETVELRPQETAMAASLIDSLAAEFDPSRFNDDYRDAMVELIERKRTSGDARPTPDAAATASDAADSMTDLLSALQRSVEAAQAAQGEAKPAVPEQRSSESKENAEPEPKKKKPAKSTSSGSSSGRSTAKRPRRTA
jgi:DNA end-binding protein Ku